MIYRFLLIFLTCLKKYNPYMEKSHHLIDLWEKIHHQINRLRWDERSPLIDSCTKTEHQDHIKN